MLSFVLTSLNTKSGTIICIMINVKEKIRTFIVDYFIKDETLALDDDASFLEEVIIDAVGVLELVAFLEQTFSFRVEDEEIIPENLDSVNKLIFYVQSKLKVAN